MEVKFCRGSYSFYILVANNRQSVHF